MKKFWVIAGVIIVLALFGIGFYEYESYAAVPVLSNSTSIGLTGSSSPPFSFDSTKAGTISYSGDCKSSISLAVKGRNIITFENVGDGTHGNCGIAVINSAGKSSKILSVPQFTVDTLKPMTTVSLNGYSIGTFAQGVNVTFSCSDAVSGCNGGAHYKINGGQEQRGNSVTFSADGIYSLEYWSFSNSGNEETHHTELKNIRIDHITPSPSIITSGGYRNSSFGIAYKLTSSGDNCYYTIDAGGAQAYAQCTGNFSGINLSDEGQHSITVHENDSAGNDQPSTNNIYINWKTIPPSITISFPSRQAYTNSTWTGVALSVSDDAVTCQYSSDNINWYNFNSCSDTSNYPLISGTGQTLYARVMDAAGNAGDTASVTFDFSSS